MDLEEGVFNMGLNKIYMRNWVVENVWIGTSKINSIYIKYSKINIIYINSTCHLISQFIVNVWKFLRETFEFEYMTFEEDGYNMVLNKMYRWRWVVENVWFGTSQIYSKIFILILPAF